jgi:hypothetical protein
MIKPRNQGTWCFIGLCVPEDALMKTVLYYVDAQNGYLLRL